MKPLFTSIEDAENACGERQSVGIDAETGLYTVVDLAWPDVIEHEAQQTPSREKKGFFSWLRRVFKWQQ